METVILLIFCGALGAFSIWCFKMVIEYDIARAKYNKKPKEQYKNKQKQYIIVEEDDEDDESDVDRQNREYGDYYGDSYYGSKRR